MGTALLLGFLGALMFSLLPGVLDIVFNKDLMGTGSLSTIINFIVLFILDWQVILNVRPWLALPGLIGLIFLNLLIVLVIGAGLNLTIGDAFGVGRGLLVFALVGCGITWIWGHNSGHDAHKASHLVNVQEMQNDALVASSTDHMVVVPENYATTKAKGAMSTGTASSRNYSTYLTLGQPVLQMVAGKMVYIFPLGFDGSGNKGRMHAVVPGYIEVSAEDPNASAVEHYDGQYTMTIGLGVGQSGEPDRYAYEHGFHFEFDDPTLEIDDQGNPYYTMTALKPQLGWTFDMPFELLVINAHNGQITVYPLGKGMDKVPSWIDRVYSKNKAKDIVNWYGMYNQADFKSLGSSDANRYKVSGDPVLTYTGSANPEWRMLLTSSNSDTSVYKIVIMDAHTGNMRVYTPSKSMSTEDTVIGAFENASGQGATNVKANKYKPVGLSLHVIYGHLTWMVAYESESSSGSNASFVGLGFVDAYNPSANNVAFGNDKATALQNYQIQLATSSGSNGNAPGQGGQKTTVSGKITRLSTDISGGQEAWYVEIDNDIHHAYKVTSTISPAIVFAQVGDQVTIQYLNIGPQESVMMASSFTDTNVPLTPSGS